MKELLITPQDRTEVRTPQQQEKKLDYIGTLRKKPGHTLFEIDTETGDIRPAEFESSYVDYTQAAAGTIYPRRVLVVKDGCIYKSCLNKKNAKKHFENFKKIN